MNYELKKELLHHFHNSYQPPYFGGFRKWCEENVVLPTSYAIPGKLDLSISPYLHKPMESIDDPKIMQVNLACATQIGKSLVSELFIPYTAMNAPAPMYRIFQSGEISDVFAEARLIPLLNNIECVKPLLTLNRHTVTKSSIKLPGMHINMGSCDSSLKHGMSVRYLLCDELHEWQVGNFDKFKARTTAFAGRRKIICASQPCDANSEWDQICSKGRVYNWEWLCPCCNLRQPFHWSKQRDDGSYAGFNWNTIENADGTTNIAESSKTTWLECFNCKHKLYDKPQDRRYLNDTGGYVCVKPDGDSSVVTYMVPNFVNVNLSFESSTTQYLLSKRFKKQTGLDEQMKIFVNQVLGKFYKKDEEADLSKIVTEHYEKELDKDWVLTMGVDVQRTGLVKYYVIRAWKKDGTESRRIDFGIARTFDEIEQLRVKHNILLPLVAVDSGDQTIEVYQECMSRGKVVDVGRQKQYVSWQPTKGDGRVSYKHSKDGITRLYSEVLNQDCQWPDNHKLKGIPAPLIMFSNFSIKTILGNLRDNQIDGVKWKIDHADTEYDKQIYSEALIDTVDKKSGLIVKRWQQIGQDNHWFDCEVLCLLQAIRAGVFSATKINEEDIKKLIDNQKKD